MATRGKPEIRTGQSLDVQPGVSNIGENQATLEALRNANIDGQDVFPQSVSTRRFSAEDGAFSGNMYAGSLLVGANGVTVTSGEPGQANPGTGLTTGLSITSSGLYLFKSSVTNVFLDGATGDASITGAITATSGSFTGSIYATDGYFVGTITIGTSSTMGGSATGLWLSATRLLMKYSGAAKIDFNTATNAYTFSGGTITAMSSVNFGVSITIGGDIVMNTTAVDGRVRFDGAAGNKYIDYDAVFGSIAAFGLVDSASASTDMIGIAQGSSSWTTLLACPYIAINAGSVDINTSGASGPNPTTRDLTLDIGTNAGNKFAVQRGGADVISFVGNSNTVTFAGDVVINGSTGLSGDISTVSIASSSTSVPLVISTDRASTGTGIELWCNSGANINIGGDYLSISAYWSSPSYQQTFYFCGGHRHFEIASSASGIKFYNNTATGDVAGNSVLFHAAGNIYFRDNGGTIHQLAYV